MRTRRDGRKSLWLLCACYVPGHSGDKCRRYGSMVTDATVSESNSYICKIEGKIGKTPGVRCRGRERERVREREREREREKRERERALLGVPPPLEVSVSHNGGPVQLN